MLHSTTPSPRRYLFWRPPDIASSISLKKMAVKSAAPLRLRIGTMTRARLSCTGSELSKRLRRHSRLPLLRPNLLQGRIHLWLREEALRTMWRKRRFVSAAQRWQKPKSWVSSFMRSSGFGIHFCRSKAMTDCCTARPSTRVDQGHSGGLCGHAHHSQPQESRIPDHNRAIESRKDTRYCRKSIPPCTNQG